MEGGQRSNFGGDNAQSKYPVGFRFKPTDEELVEYYLLPKLQGRPTVPNDAIIEADVYECDPEILINQMYRDRGEDRWHFLSPRTRKYQHGVRPSRRTADDRGRWKPSTGRSEKNPEASSEATPDQPAEKLYGDGAVKFCVNTLAYHVGPAKDEKKTKWLMHELTVPDYEIKLNSGSMTLDRYAMCTIYMSPLAKWYKDENGDTSATGTAAASPSEPGPTFAGSDQGTSSAPTTTLSSKQVGKRPVMEQQQQQPGHAAAKKRARQVAQARGAPPAPMHGNGGGAMGVPLGVGATGYYIVSGQQVQMQWPPLTSNRLQGPVQLSPQRMYQHNGRPVAASYHVQGQAPVQGLAGSSLRPPVSGHDSFGRTMMMPPPPPFGLEPKVMRSPRPSCFKQKMMMPPPRPSGFQQKMMRPPPPSGSEQKMMMHPQNGMMMNLAAGQTLPPPPPATQPGRQLPEVDMNDPYTQRVLSQLVAAMKAQESVQQQGPAAWNLPPPQQQPPPTLDAGANHPARGANATVAHPGRGDHQHQQQQQQRSSVVPAMNVSVSGGAAATAEATPASGNASSGPPVRGDADGESNADQLFADLDAMTAMPSAPWIVKEEH
ncbi:hypothetical protein PR202_ga19424 [Eleusine coracana subsp. coracana]|uniref:NAC domain-containing protein n=1 Tax=Eleusine coracana subsp. coracana TaxID=191504 RepID=A0AAV5CUJ3_ELECO|nr:hypothetical protein QOZ80_4AG0307790 [Eleusine coracana subsp. coracana]GJN02102.1 hypothetical protein PR202_ga19424 [Eleusine coracana subsp. coracana]